MPYLIIGEIQKHAPDTITPHSSGGISVQQAMREYCGWISGIRRDQST